MTLPVAPSASKRAARELLHARIADRYERGDPLTAIAAEEGVCLKTVRNVARRRGLARRRPDRRDRDRRIVARYAAGECVREIAESEGVGYPYVSGTARKAGLPPRSGWQRRYPLDEHAFDHPTDVGWWLIGLLAADGSVHAADHRVSLAQRAADADVLRAFLDYVGCPRPLTDLRLSPAAAARAWPRSPAQEARVFSRHLCAALAAHGVVPKKSHTLRLSDEAAAQPAVWLGLFDGDGSAGVARSAGRPRINWYGSRQAMQQCSAFWATRLDLMTGRPPSVLRHAGGLATVALYGSNAARAARILLRSSPVSMRRKRRVLEEIAQYRAVGRQAAGPSTTSRRPTWQPPT